MPKVEIEAQELDLLRQDVDRVMRALQVLKRDIVNRLPDEFFKPPQKITRAMLEEAVRKKYANNDTKGQAGSGETPESDSVGVQTKGTA